LVYLLASGPCSLPRISDSDSSTGRRAGRAMLLFLAVFRMPRGEPFGSLPHGGHCALAQKFAESSKMDKINLYNCAVFIKKFGTKVQHKTNFLQRRDVIINFEMPNYIT
jgi:hypothetical protein